MTQRKIRRHMFVPDAQVKPGVRIDHLRQAGEAAAEYKPTAIIVIGDWWDMPSLSSYDRGKKSFEGRRYAADVAAGNKAMALFEAPILEAIQDSHRSPDGPWNPRLVFCLGNHEQRIARAVDGDPILEGTLGYSDLALDNWEVNDFLAPVWIDGVCYSHYFANKMNGRPIGGASIDTRLKTIGHSFSQGHQQTLMLGCRPTLSGMHWGLVAGNFYQHDEEYRGYQANDEWRGIIIKNDVRDGQYNPMLLDMDFLKRKYGGRAVYA